MSESRIIVPGAPQLWTRRPKILEPRDVVKLSTGFRGYFRMRAIRPDGRCRVDTGWFPNLITDVGLDVPGTNGSICNECVVGTGNTAPSETDTSLVAQVASTTNHFSLATAANQTADRYAYAQMTFRFAAGSATGNLAEVGIKATGGVLWSRALILDGGGSPTTLTILADEVLDVTYELRVYPNITDVITTMTVSGVVYDITIRAAEVGSWRITSAGLGSWASFNTGAGFGNNNATNGSIGAITGEPSGSGATMGKSNAGYTNGTHFREFTNTLGLASGNFSPGITAFRLPMASMSSSGSESGGTRYQVGLNGGQFLPKNGTNNLSISWRHTWARRSI